jgi:hypothetical protein
LREVGHEFGDELVLVVAGVGPGEEALDGLVEEELPGGLLVAGSAVFGKQEVAKAIRELREAAKG